MNDPGTPDVAIGPVGVKLLQLSSAAAKTQVTEGVIVFEVLMDIVPKVPIAKFVALTVIGFVTPLHDEMLREYFLVLQIATPVLLVIAHGNGRMVPFVYKMFATFKKLEVQLMAVMQL